VSGVRLCDVSLERLIPALSRARTLSDALESGARLGRLLVVEGLRVPLLAAVLDARPRPAVSPTAHREAETAKAHRG